MQELAITKEYYEELKEQIRTALGEKYFSGVQVQEIILDNEYNHVDESFYPLLGINEEQGFVIYYSVNADVDITDISRAKYTMMEESFRAKGPGRTVVTLWAIQKQEKSYLLPAVVIKCARDLYEFGDALYYRIAQYADEELENEGFNPQFVERAKRYLDGRKHEVDEKYLTDAHGEYVWGREPLMQKRLHEDSKKLAEYYSAYFRSAFDDYRAVYYRHVDGFAEAKRREISERIYNALPLK